MRNCLLLCVCVVAIGATAQQKSTKSSPTTPAKIIRGAGCVESGVEKGCFILHDRKNGKAFSLFFKSNSPAIDTGISFEGDESTNASTCMQSGTTGVDVKKWTKIRMHCPQGGSK